MSTAPTTAQAGPVGRLRLPRRLVVLTVALALAVAAVTLTAVLVASGGSGSAAAQHSRPVLPTTPRDANHLPGAHP